ncbi:MAG: M14 family zinc carboxypeptidase, partial [bacterium]
LPSGSMRLLLALTCFLLLAATPAIAQPAPLAEKFGEPLILERKDFLPDALVQPWILQQPDAGDYLAHWPRAVTLQCYRFGATGNVARRVFIVGGIHGDEAVSYLLPMLLIRQLTDEAVHPHAGDLLDHLVASGTQLYIVPVVNPYGILAGERANFRKSTGLEDEFSFYGDAWEARPSWWDLRKGVDLNRNFPVNLPGADNIYQRTDGEGTHDFQAPGGCHEQELYYGGLLEQPGVQPEPANRWLHALVSQVSPDLVIALHQENRCMYVDVRDSKAVADSRWGPLIVAMHTEFNTGLPPVWMPHQADLVRFGARKDGSAIAPEDCVNDFSPGGYGAALSLISGAVITLEMSNDQTDIDADACWFPEGLLYTYAPDLALSSLRNTARLDALLSRFKGPIVRWILELDPDCPDLFGVAIPGQPAPLQSDAVAHLLLPRDDYPPM